ncbi:MAG: c-type cytochrome [Cyclobacteriaceae bacterium]|nr:c-type cytochrome [Cyclobacteriaceae bacterium]
MRKLVRILAYVTIVLMVVIVALLSYVKFALPSAEPAPDLVIEPTPARLERGKYLATSVTVCIDCHSKRDWKQFSGPLVMGTIGQGGERFDQSMGLPGVFISRNITPHGIGRYSDGELFRAITTGVTKEGRAMFPLMPFAYYGRMDPEDIYSIIAYLRTLEPIANEVPPSVPDFPMNFIINTLPQKAAPTKKPEPSELLAYGAYMTNAAGCAECHTQANKGFIIPELIYGGGREFPFASGGIVRSSNITPDRETGIGNWTEEQFVSRFKAYADTSYRSPEIHADEFNSFMPWTMYAQMSTEDLAAIYQYLMTMKPIQNKVEKYKAPAAGGGH